MAAALPSTGVSQSLPTLSVNDASVVEPVTGTVSARLSFTLSAPSTTTVTTRFATANSTATAGSDYVARNGTVTFAPGETSKTQSFTVNSDAMSEATESFFVNLSSPSGVALARTRATVTIAETDTRPDPFSFQAVGAAVPSTEQTSNSVTVTGINAPSPVTVTGGAYSVGSSPFTTAAGSVTAGQTVRVRQTSPAAAGASAGTVLTIGGVSGTYRVTTSAEPTPTVSIDDIQVIEGASGSTSARFTLRLSSSSSRQVSVKLAMADGTALAGSDYVRRTGTVIFEPGSVSKTQSFTVNGDLTHEPDETFFVDLNTPSNALLGKARGVATIVNDDAPPDTTPDQFGFVAASNVEPGSEQTSEAVIVTGMAALADISIDGGSYSLDDGAYTAAPGKVAAGQRVRVRQTASTSFEATTSAVLRIDSVEAPYAVTTRAADTTPEPFSFIAREEVAPDTLIDSTPIRVDGIDAPAAILVSDGAYSIDGGEFRDIPGQVSAGSLVAVRVKSSALPAQPSTARLSIGGVSADFVVTTATADTTPDLFAFEPAEKAPLGQAVNSNAVRLSGFDAETAIDIVGGFYSINGGPFTALPGRVSPNARVTVQVLSSFTFGESRSATLSVGGVAGVFAVTTRDVTDDGTPDPLIFDAVLDAEPATLVLSSSVTISGINIVVPIAIVGGRYQVNGGDFTDQAGEVTHGDVVVLALYSAAEQGGRRSAILTVDDVAAEFAVTTVGLPTMAEAEPAALVFEPVANAEPGSVISSAMVAVTGIDKATPISVSGGRYRINGGAASDLPGEVLPGDMLSVEVLASSDFETTTRAILTIGTVSSVYEVTTRSPDLVPDPIAFAPVTDADPLASVISAAVAVGGFETALPISVAGGSYRINGGAFTVDDGTVTAGDSVEIRVAASPSFATTVSASLTVGSVEASFSVSTRRADITPEPLSFREQTQAFPGLATVSEPVTVSGIEVPITASVSGGRYSVNGGPFLDLDGPVSQGDIVRVLVPAGPNRGDVRLATLSVGGVSAAFRVVTDAPIDTVPDFLRFPDVTVRRSTVVDSAPMVVRGINADTRISIAGGSFSINGGAFSTAAATVRGGDTVVLRGQSSASFNSAVKLVVTVGGERSEWTIRTEQQPDRLQAFTLSNASMFRGGAVVPGSTQLSEPITVLDLSTPSAISISGGSYSINDGPFSTAAGQVVRGDKVVVRLLASASFATTTSATLTIGSRSSTMTVTTTKDPVASTPSSYPDCTSHVYRELSPVPMRLFVCRPAGWKPTDRRSALVHWFGGGFVSGTTDSSISDARFWSKTHGMVGIAPDYRVNERFGGYATLTIDDARAALRWVATHADELGIDVSRIAVSGSSAGGGAAAFASLSETPITARAEDDPGARPAAMISRAGVIDITTEPQNIQYLSSFRFGPQANALSPRRNLDAAFPPTIIFHGDQDNVVGAVPAVDFCSALIVMGKVCEFRSQTGLSHDLALRNNQIRDESAVFLQRFGLLPALRE
jgi:acetyl esterase/lipase/uncharacterized protein (DUF1330 family)